MIVVNFVFPYRNPFIISVPFFGILVEILSPVFTPQTTNMSTVKILIAPPSVGCRKISDNPPVKPQKLNPKAIPINAGIFRL